MSRHPGLSAWTAFVSTHLPPLSVPPACGLALWSYGMALTRSCGRLTVATFLALLMGQKVAALEHGYTHGVAMPPTRRVGNGRPLDVPTCFIPLRGWIVVLWSGTPLALALDATSLGARFVVWTLSGVYRGGAIPGAWTVLPANEPGAWRREWLRLLRQVGPPCLRAGRCWCWPSGGGGPLALPADYPLGVASPAADHRGANFALRDTRWDWLRELVGDVSSVGVAGRLSSRRSGAGTVRWSPGGARATPPRGGC